MITGINHVGIVVDNAHETAEWLKNQMDAEELEQIELKEDNQLSIMMQIGNSRFEIMSPLSEGGGTVARYLQMHGGGLHHISLQTTNLEEELKRMIQNGVKIFGRQNVEKKEIAFAHPKTTGGILYEFLELKEK